MIASQPDVTFVIAAYNAEETIARAIESALAQREVSVEVIVADDRSSDRTADIARAFPEELVSVITLAQNSGPGGARNAGLAAARGRWIAVLDSDDAVLPDRLSRMIERAEAADAAVVVDNLEVAKDGEVLRTTMFPDALLAKIPEISLADFIASNVMFESTFSFGYMKPVFRRKFMEQHGLRYNEALRIGEDYILLASALARGGRCVVEPGAGYVYHVRDGSISRVLHLHHVQAMLAADAAFLRDHELDASARAAQAKRTRSLEEAASFLTLVDHLKARAPLKAVAAALRDPVALRHMRMPIAARLRRIAPLFQPSSEVGGAEDKKLDLGGRVQSQQDVR